MSRIREHKSMTALLLVVAILATTFFSAVPFLGALAAEPENLIANGTFDENILPHTEAYSYDNFKSVEASGRTDVPSSGYDGTAGAFNNSTSDNRLVGLIDGKQGIAQYVNIENGKTYKLSFDWGRNGDYTESDIKMVIRYSNGTWQTLYEKVFYSSSTWLLNNYVDYFKLDTSAADAIGADIQIMFTMYFSGHTGGHNAYLDNISLTECETAIPEEAPAAVVEEGFDSFEGTYTHTCKTSNGIVWQFVGNNFGIVDGGAAMNGGNVNGNKALKAPAGSNFSWIRFYAPVEQGKEYRYSWKWAAGTTGGAQNTVKSLYLYTNNFTVNPDGTPSFTWVNSSDTHELSYSATGYALNNYARTFVAERDGYVCFGFKGDATTAASYFDDFKIEEVEAQTLANENFSTLSGGQSGYKNVNNVIWQFVGTGFSIVDGGNAMNGGNPNGNNALKAPVGSAFSWLRLYVPVEKGREYNFSWKWAAGTLGGQQSTLKSVYIYTKDFVANPDGSATFSWLEASPNLHEATHTATGYALKDYSRTFVAEHDGYVCLGFKGDATTAQSFFDDVKVTTGNTDLVEKDNEDSIELVKGGNFENSGAFANEWFAYGRTAPTGEIKAGGEYSAEIDGYTDGLAQYVTLEKGRKYKLSFDFNGNAEGAERKLDISVGDMLSKTVITSVNGFNKYEYTFIATKNATVPLKLSRIHHAGKVYVDNVSLRTVVNDAGEDYVSGGDFETAPSTDSAADFISAGKKGWCATAAQWDSTAPIAGTHSLKLSNTDSALGVFSVDPDSVVRLELDCLADNNSSAKLTVSRDADGNQVILSKTLNGSGALDSITEEFNTDDATNVYIRVESVSGDNYFDNVSLTKLYKVTVLTSSLADVTVDKKGALKDETVTLTLNSVEEGYSLREGFPKYDVGNGLSSMQKQSDTVYTLTADEADTTIYVETAAAYGYELLPDYGFESGTFSESANDGWKLGTFPDDRGEQGEISTDAYDGNYALLLKNQSYQGAEYHGIKLEKGSTYRMSFYHYGAVDIDTQLSGISLLYNNGSYEQSLYDFEVGDDDDWNRYSFEFTAADDYVVKARIKNHGSGSASALFDNISLKKIVPGSPDPEAWTGNYDYSGETAPSTDELLKDKSFEDYAMKTDARKGWKIKNSSANQFVSFAGAEWALTDGETSLRIGAGGNDAVYQIIKVKPGTSYKISFDILLDEVGGGIKIGNSLTNAGTMLDKCDLPATYEMTSYSFYFQAEAQDEAYVILWNGCNSQAVYYDNLSIVELDDRIEGNLGFRKTARITVKSNETDATVTWPTVKSKLYHNEDLTYDIYYSTEPITQANIASLTPLATKNGAERRTYKVTGLTDLTTYYYAVVGKDPAGNSALLLSEAATTLEAPTYAVKNGGFETGDISSWYKVDNIVARAHTSSFSGRYCVEAKGWLTALYQPVLVEPNAKYVWSFAGADQTGKANFYIYSTAAMADTAPHYVKQTFDATQVWTLYSGTFTTEADQERVTLALKNNHNGLFVYADNFYLKKIENEDLYFISEPADVMNGSTYIVFEWKPVTSKDDPENITYTFYYSESPINAGNIGLLKAHSTTKGSESTFATITGLELDKGYYVAVTATDTLGNTVTEYASHPFYARNTTLVEEEEGTPEDDEIKDETQELPKDEEESEKVEQDEETKTPVADTEDNNTSDEDNKEDEKQDVEEEVIEPQTETKETTTYIKKAVSDVAYGKLIPAIVMFVVAAALVVLAILLIKKRPKKLGVYAIIAFVLAAVLIGLGIWLATTSFTTVIKTEAKTSTQEVLVENSDVSSTDDTSSDDDASDYTSSEDASSSDSSSDNSSSEEKEDNSSQQNTSSDSSVVVTPEEPTYKTYYVSASMGNDANDGLTPETAIKSIDKVNKLSLEEGDKVLFKSGDLWRAGTVKCAVGVTYSSYGKGEKPAFYGGYTNLADAKLWVATEYPNVYTLSDTAAKKIGVVGTLWFDNDKQFAVMDVPYGEKDDKVMITPDMLSEDLHFCCDYETNEIFLYSTKGNPGSRFEVIEASPDVHTFALNNDVTIDGLNVKYYDYGIVGTDISGATIRNMEMSHMGGVWATNLQSRAGNAIELWKNASDILIENNVISQCYDTAITCQYTGSTHDTSNVVIKNVTVRGNKISDCWWSTEFWLKMPGNGVNGEIRNLVITENEFKNAGMGWGARTAPNYTVHSYHIHCFAYSNYNAVDMKIINNVFDTSKFSLFCFGWTNFMPTLKGNTYIQSRTGQFGYVYQRPLAFNEGIFEVIRQFDKNATLKFSD